jgi:ABC-2 type transport system permease protein
VRKDFLRKWRSPVVIIGFILIPVILTVIFGMIFGSGKENIMPKISILAVDKDQSFLSRFFLSAFEQGELNKLIDLRIVEEEEGRRRIKKGKASALLIIPEKFGKSLWEEDPITIELLKNPSEQFLPQIVEEITDTMALLLSSLFSVFSDEIDAIKSVTGKEELLDEEISVLSVQIKNRIQGISKYVMPPVISLSERTIGKEKEKDTLNVFGYVLPAIAFMFLLFICNTVFEDILREKESGTLLRMTVSSLNVSDFIWSKIFISAVIGISSTFILMGLGRIIFSIRWGNYLLVFLIVISINLMIAGFISIFYAFIQTERQAGAVLSSVILIMSLLGGSMIPASNFPPFIVNYFSKLTLNYWGITAFHKAMMGMSYQEILPIILGMTFAGIIFSSLGCLLLNRKILNGLMK